MANNSLRDDVKAFLVTNWLQIVLTVIMGILITVMAVMLMNPKLNQREIALITFIMTAASTVASFLVSKIYADSASSKTLRDHGVQIASGIMVLRRQIDALGEWVEAKREAQQGTSNGPGDPVLEHVQETLSGFREMTDAALGGIGGVIGDALAQYEAVMGQISNTRAEAVRKTSQIERQMQTAESSTELARLESQIEEIASSTEKKIAQLARSSALPIPSSALPIPMSPPRRLVSVPCPHCGVDQSFEILDRPGETRVRVCSNCAKRFNVHIGGGKVFTRIAGLPIPVTAVSPASESMDRVSNASDAGALEIRGYIKARYIEPDDLAKLITAAAALDARGRLRATVMTPLLLQQSLLEAPELASAAVSRKNIRVFFQAIFHSKAFVFAPGAIGANNPYQNALTEGGLVEAMARSYVWLLSEKVSLKREDASTLAAVLFEDRFSGATEAVANAIAALPPGRGPAAALSTGRSENKGPESGGSATEAA